MSSSILQPVAVLVLWSMVMWAWLYATRIPAITRAKVEMAPSMTKAEFDSHLPAHVRWKADNYNHLMEQPTLFYAVALALAVLGQADGLTLALAWAYVGIRIAHSLVQALTNVIMLRFAIFMIASLALAVRLAMAVF